MFSWIIYRANDIRKAFFYNLFIRFGEIRQTFIPNKRSKITGKRFGFVRYVSNKDAEHASYYQHKRNMGMGPKIDGQKGEVSEKTGRSTSKRGNIRLNRIYHDATSFRDQCDRGHQSNHPLRQEAHANSRNHSEGRGDANPQLRIVEKRGREI